MSSAWKTKYGKRRVKHEPPTLDDAIFAARGLTDNLQQQVEIGEPNQKIVSQWLAYLSKFSIPVAQIA